MTNDETKTQNYTVTVTRPLFTDDNKSKMFLEEKETRHAISKIDESAWPFGQIMYKKHKYNKYY